MPFFVVILSELAKDPYTDDEILHSKNIVKNDRSIQFRNSR